MKKFEIYTDGACKGNPGEAAIGVVINCDGKCVGEISKPIGEATNNIAEYSALVFGLQELLVLRADDVNVYTDSELVYKQVIGAYKIKNAKLKFLNDQVKSLARGFKSFKISHVPREKNKDADRLASEALKETKEKQTDMVASLFEYSEEESPSSKGRMLGNAQEG